MIEQHDRIFLSPPHMGGSEEQFVQEAFASNYIAPLGAMVDRFERDFSKYTGIPYCLAVSSGTAAMHLALRCLAGGNAKKNEEKRPVILASSLTFIGSVTPAVFEGLDLVFLDSDRGSWNMDPALLEEELKWREVHGCLPIAVVPTDLYGQPSDIMHIRDVCDRFSVPVICDSAEAVGGHYRTAYEKKRHAGYDAYASVFSFNGNKIITTSGGGMLASHDKELIAHARKLSTQARDNESWYEHSEIGYNYRMSNIVAAIGVGQLEVLDSRVQRRREIFARYQDMLSGVNGITFMPEPDYARGNRWLTVILIDPDEFGADTHAVRLALEAVNIEARPVWKPMHMQPVFRDMVDKYQSERRRSYAVCEDLFARGLCLPSGTAMSDSDIERICSVILGVHARR